MAARPDRVMESFRARLDAAWIVGKNRRLTMTDTRETPYSYDEVPYPSLTFPQSHPDRLAAIARLFGLKPAPIGSSRILEIGCASGGNFVPLAEQLPEARLVGIDLSTKQVAVGQRLVEQAGLTNVEL